MRRHLANIFAALALLLSISALTSCQDSDQSLSKLKQQVESAYESASNSISDLNPQEHASQELAKLSIFEYRVIALPTTTDTETLQMNLQKLGLERWELVEVLTHPDTNHYIFKRRPETYLKYIPRWIP